MVYAFDTITDTSAIANKGHFPGYKFMESGYYIPHITSDEPILYDFPTIHNLLGQYLEDKDIVVWEKKAKLGKFINV